MKLTPLSALHTSNDNPRIITDPKLEGLINSILVLPKMLELRPIVTDGSGGALGGNMRLRSLIKISAFTPQALTERISGLRDFKLKSEKQRKDLLAWWLDWLKNPVAPAIAADELTDGEKREFIIKDNATFGDWDWEKLVSEWDSTELQGWGVDMWSESTESAGDNLPPELLDVDLTPDKLEPISGSGKTENERIIIVYPKEREGELAKLLGVEAIEKVIYKIEEIIRPGVGVAENEQ